MHRIPPHPFNAQAAEPPPGPMLILFLRLPGGLLLLIGLLLLLLLPVSPVPIAAVAAAAAAALDIPTRATLLLHGRRHRTAQLRPPSPKRRKRRGTIAFGLSHVPSDPRGDTTTAVVVGNVG
jgi:hypothetical protein